MATDPIAKSGGDGSGQFGNTADPAVDVFGDVPGQSPITFGDVAAVPTPAAPIDGMIGSGTATNVLGGRVG